MYNAYLYTKPTSISKSAASRRPSFCNLLRASLNNLINILN